MKPFKMGAIIVGNYYLPCFDMRFFDREMGVSLILLLPFTIFHVLLSLKWDNNAPLGNVPSVPTEMGNL